MFWAMFCSENLGPAIHVNVSLTHVTYLSTVADHTLSWKWYLLVDVASFSRIPKMDQEQQGIDLAFKFPRS